MYTILTILTKKIINKQINKQKTKSIYKGLRRLRVFNSQAKVSRGKAEAETDTEAEIETEGRTQQVEEN